MKAQFKYIFRGEALRLIAFAVIFTVNLVFIVLGALGISPLAARIVAVSLSGTAVGTMAIFNIIGDITIINRMFSPSAAVLHALTPAPRRDRLIASVISMTIMDLITMAVSITGVVILALGLGSYYTGESISEMLSMGSYYGNYNFPGTAIIAAALLLAGYLYIIMLIVFCKSVRKSVLYNKPAGGFLAFLVAVGVVYVSNIATFLLLPFGTVHRFYASFVIHVGALGMGMYAVLIFIITAVMFVITSRLMERKINI